ncbi:MAG: helix-turn-helix transcriptional regulator [Actinomycetota bacterium]|nr:helix-turn-helix transcriptional regulator [Actinomycetota bacterium]
MARGGEGDSPTESCRPTSHFNLAPPRNFLYPAILLLLGEEARHGYRLLDALLSVGFGPVDRASVYRALSEMEADQFLQSWRAPATAGSARHVYGLTDAGMVALRGWMAIVAEERDALDSVLKRFDVMLGEER